MTKPSRERQIAEEIGRKAVSDDYVEDGGYIRDWLVNDIEQAIRQRVLEVLDQLLEKPDDEFRRAMLDLRLKQLR